MKALVFEKFGGPEVLHYTEIPTPQISENEILVSMKAIGLNYADIYRRKGNYHLVGDPPYICGYEGAGVVEQVGKNVDGVNVGDRIAFADVPFANAELVAVPFDKLIPLPDKISFETAASVMLQGLTAQYLTSDSYQIKAGDSVLIHAAAGGVGQILVQIAKMVGAKVIGLTSSKEKTQKVLDNGADFVFLYSEDWVSAVKDVTECSGVEVVYESVGSTIMESFEATKIRGTVVFYGMAGGDPVHIDPRMLMDTSKTLTGGDLWNVLTSHDERVQRSEKLFRWIQDGFITLPEPTVFPLKEGAEAHKFLESRKSTGKILLIP